MRGIPLLIRGLRWASQVGRGRTPEGAAGFGNRQTAPDERECGGACVNLTEEDQLTSKFTL